MIWNIRKQKPPNQNSKKKKETTNNEDNVRSLWGNFKYTTWGCQKKKTEHEIENLLKNNDRRLP